MKSLIGAAALAVACSIGMAAAQESSATESTHSPPGQDLLDWVVQHANVKSGTKANGVIRMTDGVKAPITTGWIYGDATYCGFYTPDSLKDQWFYVFVTQNGQVAYTFYSVNDAYIAQGLAVPCGAGNEIAVHVVNSQTGAFDKTQSYPHP